MNSAVAVHRYLAVRSRIAEADRLIFADLGTGLRRRFIEGIVSLMPADDTRGLAQEPARALALGQWRRNKSLRARQLSCWPR